MEAVLQPRRSAGRGAPGDALKEGSRPMRSTKTKAELLAGRDRDDLSADLLSGLNAIAEYRGESRDRTHRLLKKRLIPGWIEYGRWYALRSSLRRAALEREAKAMAGAERGEAA